MKTQDWQNDTSIRTPWGQSQQSRCIAEGITQVSTAGHGGIMLDDERWAEFQRRIPGYIPRYGGPQCFEEDCEWAAVVIAFPEHYDEQAIYDAVQTCRVWMKEIVIPPALLPRFVWNTGSIKEEFPDMPEQSGAIDLVDRSKGRVVVSIAEGWGQLFCLEHAKHGQPFTDLATWMNGLSKDDLESEGLPTA